MPAHVSIVIPVYNRAHTLGRTLASIDAQTMAPERVVIVDNNSTDSSLGIACEWAKGKSHVSVVTEPNPGACAARNRGLKEVDTEWTMFFDSDDVMLRTHIDDFAEAVDAYPEAAIIGRDIITRFLDGSARRLYFMDGGDVMFHHLFRGSLSTQRYIARTALFRNAGGWNESLPGWNDFELGVRLILSADSASVVKLHGEPSVITYQQEQSISGLRFSDHPERWERSLDAIRSLFLVLPDDDSRRRQMLDWLDARAMILAAQYAREARVAEDACRDRSQRLASGVYDAVMSRTRHPRRMRMIYRHNLWFGRLTWMLVRMMF